MLKMNENQWPKLQTFRVAIRVRPFLKHETRNIPAIRFLPNDAQMLVADDKPYVFDHIYNEESQENFYASLICPMVTKLLEGYHCTVMAYGHTGTGKTHTMGSGLNAEDGVNAGLLHRSLDDIFLRAAQQSDQFAISISAIEIYNDKAYDLLGDAERPLKVARMCSASSHFVQSRCEAVTHFKKGILARHTRSTKLNHQSSRSHALFTVNCNIKNGDHETNACLHLVDLAGTEGLRETGHEGAAFTEGIKINQSLLGLHLLLRNLAKSENVSYRESLLTTLLQDALNSNNYVTLIGCISPSMEHIKSTLSTLDFVSGAKSVRSKPQLQLQYKEFKKEDQCDGDHTKEDVVFLVPRTPQSTVRRIPFNNVNTPLSRAKHIYGKKTCVSKSYTGTPKPSITPRKPFTPRKNNTFCTPFKPKLNMYKMNSTTDFRTKVKSISSTPATTVPSAFKNQSTAFEYSGFISDMSRISTSSHVSALSETKTYSPVINKIRGEVEGILSRLEGLERERRNKQKKDVTLEAMENVAELESYTIDNSTLTKTMVENEKEINKKVRRSVRISQRKNRTNMNNTLYDTRLLTMRKLRDKSLGSRTMKEPQQNATSYPLKASNGHFTINLTMDKMGNPVILDAYGMPSVTPVNKAKSKENVKKLQSSPPRSSSYHRIRKLVLHILNTSSVEDLQVLETVGPVTAQLIFEHRERIGKFRSLRELKNVPFWKHKAYHRFLTANNL